LTVCDPNFPAFLFVPSVPFVPCLFLKDCQLRPALSQRAFKISSSACLVRSRLSQNERRKASIPFLDKLPGALSQQIHQFVRLESNKPADLIDFRLGMTHGLPNQAWFQWTVASFFLILLECCSVLDIHMLYADCMLYVLPRSSLSHLEMCSFEIVQLYNYCRWLAPVMQLFKLFSMPLLQLLSRWIC